jgi:predicted AlkP superfamily pyrophosphatase or phosphodiesterase
VTKLAAYALINMVLIFIIMENIRNKIWYQDSTMLNCNIEQFTKSLSDLGEHYKKLISVYPGITFVELKEQGKDQMTIKTNEGMM